MIKYLMMQKRQLTVLLVLLMVLCVTMTGFAWNNKDITIVSDGQTQTIKTHLNSADGILREAGIAKGQKDAVILSTPTLQEGTTITVVRAFPVKVTVDGVTKQVMTVQTSPQALAAELGYKAPNYVPLGNANDVLQANSELSIAHITSRSVKTSERQVEVQTVREPDDQLAKGEESVVQTGTPGTEKIAEEILFENGKEVKRQIISHEPIVAMVPTIVKEGTRENVVPTAGDMRYKEIITMDASAYLPSDGGGSGITATGMVAERGVVAVDPSVIPLGTRLYIPGYGMAIAGDTGGAIIGNRIDLVMESYSEAMNFGRRSVEVYVLE